MQAERQQDAAAGAAMAEGPGLQGLGDRDLEPHLNQNQQRVAGVQAAGEHGLQPRDGALPVHHRRLEQRHLVYDSSLAASASARASGGVPWSSSIRTRAGSGCGPIRGQAGHEASAQGGPGAGQNGKPRRTGSFTAGGFTLPCSQQHGLENPHTALTQRCQRPQHRDSCTSALLAALAYSARSADARHKQHVHSLAVVRVDAPAQGLWAPRHRAPC